MKNISHKFELIDGRIHLVLTMQIWGEEIVEKREITDSVMPVVDDYLDEQLGLTDYKRVNGAVTYIGKDK